MTQYRFETHLQQTLPGSGKAMCAGRPTIELSTPPEFGGPEGYWGPEDLFLSAIESCLMMSFAFRAKKHGLAVQEYRSRTVGHLEKQPAGLAFTLVEIFVQMEVDGDPKLALRLLQEAHQSCPIRRSIAPRVEIHPQVWTLATAPQVD